MPRAGAVPDEFNFSIEYAKSDRSMCRTTREKIPKGALRIAEMIQSETFDGRIPSWHQATKTGFFLGNKNKGLISTSMIYNW
eukprot:COSAG04_NODE_4131_length_2278_cov_1.483708_2_plen_82_part_00